METTETAAVDDAEDLCGFVNRIYAAWERTREHVIEIGEALIEAKAKLPHGSFTKMIEEKLPFGPDTARRFMRIVADPRLSNHDRGTFLPTSVKALDEIRKLPDDKFEEAVETGAIHPNMTVQDAVEIVQAQAAQNDPRPEPKPPARIDPTEPDDGIIRCYGDLVAMLRNRRQDLGLAQLEVDAASGMQDGYTGKLEQPDRPYGKRAVYPMFDLWLGGLRVGLKLVPLD